MDNMGILTEHLSKGLALSLVLSLPAVLIAASVGLVIGILQAVTQVQEQTISAAPKILSVFLMLLLGGGLMMSMLQDYIRESAQIAFQEIPQSSDFILPPRNTSEGSNRARAFFKAQTSGDANAVDKLRMSPGLENANEDAQMTPKVNVNSARYHSPLGPAERLSLQKKRQ
jgi:flagellar biosynthesis protein FliQ